MIKGNDLCQATPSNSEQQSYRSMTVSEMEKNDPPKWRELVCCVYFFVLTYQPHLWTDDMTWKEIDSFSSNQQPNSRSLTSVNFYSCVQRIYVLRMSFFTIITADTAIDWNFHHHFFFPNLAFKWTLLRSLILCFSPSYHLSANKLSLHSWCLHVTLPLLLNLKANYF